MPRQKNDLQSVELRMSTTLVVREYLEQLVATGLWGKNVTEAAERMLTTSLVRMIENGELRKKGSAASPRSADKV